jgi:hypothetical protein
MAKSLQLEKNISHIYHKEILDYSTNFITRRRNVTEPEAFHKKQQWCNKAHYVT